MGDPFSIAVGALQVAEVGFKLCDTLHSSVRDFKNAEKDVKRVASEVRTASWALKQLGALLQQDEAIKRTKPGAISEANTALNQCSEAFAEVQIILPAAGSGSSTSISAATRFKWTTRKSKVDALLANLERLKTTLVLVFKVISYAKEIASSPKDPAIDEMDMRFQLETLIKSKNEAVRRYEQLVKSLNQARLDDDSTYALGLDSASQKSNTGLNLMSLPSVHATRAQSDTSGKSPASVLNPGDKDCENHDLTKGLTEALGECHKAASGLSECLPIVHIQWRAMQKYDGGDIWKNYRLTNKAMRALEAFQLKPIEQRKDKYGAARPIPPQRLGQDAANSSTSAQQPSVIIRHGDHFEPAEEPNFATSFQKSNDSVIPTLAPFQTLSPPIDPEAKTLPSFKYPAHSYYSYPEHQPTSDEDPGTSINLGFVEPTCMLQEDASLYPESREDSYPRNPPPKVTVPPVSCHLGYQGHGIEKGFPGQSYCVTSSAERVKSRRLNPRDHRLFNSKQEDLDVPSFTSAFAISAEDIEDPVDALLREWTTVRIF